MEVIGDAPKITAVPLVENGPEKAMVVVAVDWSRLSAPMYAAPPERPFI